MKAKIAGIKSDQKVVEKRLWFFAEGSLYKAIATPKSNVAAIEKGNQVNVI